MKRNQSIGLVLSGGGVRGAAHAGILKALEEHSIYPDRLSGSSAGAIVGALYAAGYKPEEILLFFKTNARVFRWRHVTYSKPGILDAEKYAELFEPWLNGHTFESLAKELHICVTDVLNGKSRFFSSGELFRPILASAAVPGIFSPVEIDDQWYIDGGTMNNFPVEPLKGSCRLLLGSFVSPKKTITKEELGNTLKLIGRANDLGFLAASLSKFNWCDGVFIPQELHKYGVFDTKKMDEIYELGYRSAQSQMKKILPLLELKQYSLNGERQAHFTPDGNYLICAITKRS